MSFTYGGNRVDLNDSDGEPLGSVIVPVAWRGLATLQYSTDISRDRTPPYYRAGKWLTQRPMRNNATYVITEVGDAQSQGDYAKCSVSFYEKIN